MLDIFKKKNPYCPASPMGKRWEAEQQEKIQNKKAKKAAGKKQPEAGSGAQKAEKTDRQTETTRVLGGRQALASLGYVETDAPQKSQISCIDGLFENI